MRTLEGLDHSRRRSVEKNTNNNRQESLHWGLYPDLPTGPFGIIYADPPLDYKRQLQHNGAGGKANGSAVLHYPTVRLEQLMELPVSTIADDNCLLFMWSSMPHLEQAINLGKSWGFQWATVAFVWDKQQANREICNMSQCELCLCFKWGKIPTPRGSRNVRQWVSIKRGKHSSKPAEVRNRIDDMFPEQRKVELFARERVSGWTTWGLDSHE